MVARRFAVILALFAVTSACAQQSSTPAASPDTSPPDSSPQDRLFRGLVWRQIGPFRGGRVLAVAGVPSLPQTYYFGGVAGGVWKTEDAGLNWRPIFDKVKDVASIGAVAVSESDPNVVYVGTGEACIRGNIVAGNGVYKSTDGGKNWQHIGLADTQTIGHLIVHPRNPDVALVAAMGHVYGRNTERGVFRTADGGKTWQKVLYKDDHTGAVDVQFDPNNPNIVFAALWEARRSPWEMVSGGPGGGLYRSTDGGVTWKQLNGHGLPEGILGRIGITVSGANSNRIYAMVESTRSGLYRSEDGGDSWRLINPDSRLWQRAWYYMHVFADPKNADTVYVLNTSMLRSSDGGRTFTTVPAPHGDHHGLWIDPTNPQRMINSNDGGANVSNDGGQSWTTQDNQPTAQFYHVIADNRFPYYVYGAQQDNSTVAIATRGSGGGIDRSDWYPVGGGESGYIAPDPRDANIVYAGSYGNAISRLDRRTGQAQAVTPWPENPMGYGAADLKYRFQWTAPIVISPHDPNVVYHASNVLFKTSDGGMSWTAISPDLTRNDKSKQGPSGGPLTKDNTSVEYFDTIFSVAESPVQKDLIWVGTDDGLVQLTNDGGKTWQNVTPKEMPEWGRVNLVEASPRNAGAAYVAVERHELDDWQPYIFKTSDFGKTWTRINNGIPQGKVLHAVREDPARAGLLYAGTENGIFVSFDDGANWRPWIQRNLPPGPVHDLIVKGNDIVVAMHGRAFWVLDNIAPIRQYSAEIANADAQLYQPEPALRIRGGGFGGGGGGGGRVGQNPPNGAVLYYWLKNAITGPQAEGGAAAAGTQEGPATAGPRAGRARPEITLEISDAQGKLVRRFSNLPRPQPRDVDEEDLPPEARRALNPTLPAEAGLNRFVWNLRYDDAARIPNSPIWAGSTTGPMVPPGTYQVKLTVAGKPSTQSLEVKMDPRVTTSAADVQRQFELLSQIHDKLDATHKAVNQIRGIRRQMQDVVNRVAGTPAARPIADASRALNQKMTPIEEELVQVKSRASEDPLNFPIKLNNKLASLAGGVESADAAPTKQALEVYAMLSRQIDEQLAKWKQVLAHDVQQFNDVVRQQNVPAISGGGEATGGAKRTPE